MSTSSIESLNHCIKISFCIHLPILQESAITDNGRRDSEPVAIYDDELNQVVMFESVKHSKLAAPVQAPALARSSEPTSEPPSVRVILHT